MLRVYVAGRYSADNVMDVLRNIGRGEEVCSMLLREGYAPFCPWHDRSYVIREPDTELTVADFQKVSMAWLEACDAVFLVPGWVGSKGTRAEIDRAKALSIPVFDCVGGLNAWAQGRREAPGS